MLHLSFTFSNTLASMSEAWWLSNPQRQMYSYAKKRAKRHFGVTSCITSTSSTCLQKKTKCQINEIHVQCWKSNNKRRNHRYFDGLYHPFMVKLEYSITNIAHYTHVVGVISPNWVPNSTIATTLVLTSDAVLATCASSRCEFHGEKIIINHRYPWFAYGSKPWYPR